jgi:hypothetical protein
MVATVGRIFRAVKGSLANRGRRRHGAELADGRDQQVNMELHRVKDAGMGGRDPLGYSKSLIDADEDRSRH